MEGTAVKRICKICQKAFAHSSSLSRHMKNDHKGENGSIPCNQCSDRFVTAIAS